MKFKILIMASTALASFSSCTVFVKGHGNGHGEHGEAHEHGNRTSVQPLNKGSQNSFAASSILQPSVQVPAKNFFVLNID